MDYQGNYANARNYVKDMYGPFTYTKGNIVYRNGKRKLTFLELLNELGSFEIYASTTELEAVLNDTKQNQPRNK